MVQALREIIELENFDEASFIEALSLFECVKQNEETAQDVKRFLVEDAIGMERDGDTRTYLILDDECWVNGEIKINGYFSIALKVLTFSKDIDEELLCDVFGKKKNNCPAYLIGQLARSIDTKSGVGKEFLRTALEYIAQASDIVGGRFIYLDCNKDKRAYYEKQGFKFLQDKHKSDLIQMYRII